MDHREPEETSEEWRRLARALFPAPRPADPRATEAFTARVMGRLREERVPAWQRWLSPALGLALAGLLAAIMLPGIDADVPLDEQLVSAGASWSEGADALLGVQP